jgi:16S rRNA (cytosine967-C5)-methyltransferase
MTTTHGVSQRHPDPRRLGLEILGRLEASDLTLDHLLADALETHPHMDARDRSLCNALVYGVQRWRGRLDWILAHFARRRPETLPPRLHNLMRLGLFQICFLDRVPKAAAVNTSVQLAKAIGEGPRAGFVNGLLRNAARHYASVPLPDAHAAPDTHLAVRYALPRWLVRRWLKRFGFEETAALGEALTTLPPLTVRANTLRTTPERLSRDLAKIATVTPSAYTPLGLRLAAVTQPPASWPALEAGMCQVQDEAAQLAGDLLAPRPGETVLDACAGLGGKTGHLGQMMAGGGRLIAADRIQGKLERLRVEMRRLGIPQVETLSLDCAQKDALADLPL